MTSNLAFRGLPPRPSDLAQVALEFLVSAGRPVRILSEPLMRSPFFAAIGLLLVMLTGMQSSWAAFACRFDGKVRDHCCCVPRQQGADEPLNSAPSLAAQGCCDVSISALREAPPARETAPAAAHHPSVIAPAISAASFKPRIENVIATLAIARPPPPPRIALFLDKQALLR